MKREIKFRAWDEGNKTMHNNFQFIKSGEEGNDWIVFVSDKQPLNIQVGTHPLENPYFSQQLKIMQFTGLKDKNGVKIYEGDIITHNGTTDEVNLCVTFRDGSFCIGIDGIRDTEMKSHVTFRDAIAQAERAGVIPVFEVIGNIYSNPELLK